MMHASLAEVKDRVESILKKEETEYQVLSDEERVNRFLDSILSLKKILEERVRKVKELDDAFAELTWFDNYPPNLERELESLIERAFSFHKHSVKIYADLNKKFTKPNLFKQELKDYKYALDDFEDTVIEVKDILFDYRKDKTFMKIFRAPLKPRS